MRERTITALLLIVAIIHLLPVSGVLGVDRLAALYDVAIDNADMEILMRHRAILFGVLGAFIAYAAFKPALQPVAFVAAAVSIVSFLVLAYTVGGFGAAIQKVVIADIIAAVALLLAVGLRFQKVR